MPIVPSLLAVWLLQVSRVQGAASSEAVCGQPVINSPRIVGGQAAAYGSWPWQVAIFQGGYFICGGSLIAEQWVLSAAHCFLGSTATSQYDLLLGAYELLNLTSTVVESSVEQILTHPDYNGKAGSSGDIALLELRAPVNFTKNILPTCLPDSSAQFPLNADCWVTGWGNIQEGVLLPSPLTLQEVKLPLMSQAACNNIFNSHPVGVLGKNPIKPDMICAGNQNSGKDSCQGDSGGPLVCKLQGRWTQAGVVSWGVGCASPFHPGVYTSVPFYANWIQATMNGESQNGGSQNAPVVTFLLMALVTALL
ncbi:serine protease 27-like [Elgaria multicarinata webbii]|uniref:serine protease 27-like n=1 Tax=Elgaria multicarinata webbii TaxID=159646 RepID=UPI002FCD5034